MSNINCSDLQMCIEKNLYEMVSEHRHWSKSTVYNTSSILQTVCSVPFHVFNSITAANLRDEDLDLQIKKIIKPYLSAGVPVCWYVTPSCKPDKLCEKLIENGFNYAGTASAMAMNISNIEIKGLKLDKGFEVELVDNERKIRDWAGVFCQGYELPSFVEEAYWDFYNDLIKSPNCKIKSFVGYKNSKPICTATLVLGQTSASIFDLVTIPCERGLGYAAQISQTLLHKAKEKGYETCTLISSQSAYNMYKKIGFNVYGEIICYLHSSINPEKVNA